jgi:transcriptional regulator with XRE-family HTH domain
MHPLLTNVQRTWERVPVTQAEWKPRITEGQSEGVRLPGPDGILIKDPSYTAASRIREVRKRRGWSAQRLAQECARHGMPQLNRDVLANIESGRRKAGITLEELFTLALALNVAPVHLMVDTSDGPEATTAVGHFSLPPKLAREWIIGKTPITPVVDPRIYFSEVPPSGWDSGNLSPEAIETLGEQAEALQQLQADVRGFDQSGPESAD